MTGFVYIMRAGDFAKVGRSKNPTQRLAQIDRNSPVKPVILRTFDAVVGLEFKLHRYLLDHHARHEWFHWCEKLDGLVSDGLPPRIYDMPLGSPFYPNKGGRKPKQAGAA